MLPKRAFGSLRRPGKQIRQAAGTYWRRRAVQPRRGRRVAHVELLEKRVELLAAEGRPRGETGSGGGRSFMS